MKINYKVVSAVLALGLAWDTRAYYKNKKSFLRVQEDRDNARAIVRYLGRKLEQNRIELNEFDDIVLHNHGYRIR